MSLIQHHRFNQNWFHQFVFMILFPRWPVIGLFRTAKLYSIPPVIVSSSGSELQTTDSLKSVMFLEHLQEFHLDICIPSYSSSPQVFCLWMNSGRGWNPNLEGSYLPDYSEYEADFWTQCSSGFYLRSLKFSASDTSSKSEYSDCTKT